MSASLLKSKYQTDSLSDSKRDLDLGTILVNLVFRFLLVAFIKTTIVIYCINFQSVLFCELLNGSLPN